MSFHYFWDGTAPVPPGNRRPRISLHRTCCLRRKAAWRYGFIGTGNSQGVSPNPPFATRSRTAALARPIWPGTKRNLPGYRSRNCWPHFRLKPRNQRLKILRMLPGTRQNFGFRIPDCGKIKETANPKALRPRRLKRNRWKLRALHRRLFLRSQPCCRPHQFPQRARLRCR